MAGALRIALGVVTLASVWSLSDLMESSIVAPEMMDDQPVPLPEPPVLPAAGVPTAGVLFATAFGLPKLGRGPASPSSRALLKKLLLAEESNTSVYSRSLPFLFSSLHVSTS